jgi:hypothetical protein
MMIRKGIVGKIVDKTEQDEKPSKLGDVPASIIEALNQDSDCQVTTSKK